MTGAADTGVEFARVGLRTRTLRTGWRAADLHGAEVVVINTASRAAAVQVAYAAVRQTVERLSEAGAGVIYKKVDSTLRGPLGAELDAALDACGLSLAVVCPAFPAVGRTLMEGVLLVDGVPVAQGAAGHDPITPVRASHLPTLLAGQTRRPVHAIARPPAGYSCAGLAAQWQSLLPEGGIVVVDAGDERDLAQIAEAAQALSRPPLLVGSAGLARFVAANLVQRQKRRVLVLCGSLHPQARAQVRALQAQPLGEAVTILTTPPDRTPSAAQQPSRALAQTAADWLAEHAAAGVVVTGVVVTGVIVTGGDTLDALLTTLDAAGMDLEQPPAPEVMTGVALGRVAGGPWAGLRIVSKAGGFGPVDALVQAVRSLQSSV